MLSPKRQRRSLCFNDIVSAQRGDWQKQILVHCEGDNRSIDSLWSSKYCNWGHTEDKNNSMAILRHTFCISKVLKTRRNTTVSPGYPTP